MSGGPAAGFVAALAGATLYGASPVLQARAARHVGPGAGVGLRLTLRLLRRPVWLLGLLCDVGGFLSEAFAFSNAPATFVAPLFACDVVAFVLLARVLLGDPLTPGLLSAIATAVAGVALLSVTFGGGDRLGRVATTTELVALVAGSIVVAVLAVLAVRRDRAARGPALPFAIASGVAYAVATLTTRQVGRTFDPAHPWSLLATVTPYALAVASVLAIVLEQRGLQIGTLVTFPVVSAVSAFVPVIVGATLLDEQVPGGVGRLFFVLALALIGVGLLLLGRSRPRID